MNAQAIPAEAATDKFETENDRFKRSFGSWFWGSMIAATVVHFMLFSSGRLKRRRTCRSPPRSWR